MTGTSWHSYPSIHNLGHRAIADLFSRPVRVEEKYDGSQISFGNFDGELRIKSKGAVIVPEAPPKLFAPAVSHLAAIHRDGLLTDGWTYRGECISAPRHNALTYSRVPNGCIVLFDVNTAEESYMMWDDVQSEAACLGLEPCRVFYHGRLENYEHAMRFMEAESTLGGPKIEGLVFKSDDLYGTDHKLLMGKHVSEAFKEVHRKSWGQDNPKRPDALAFIAAKYATPARYQKALIHLRERGLIEGEPRDIGKLIAEAKRDLSQECTEGISLDLYRAFGDEIVGRAIRGIPTWYKELLAESQFATPLEEGEAAA